MDKSAKLPSSENPKQSTTVEWLATESSVHPETIVTDGQFAEGGQALKEIREDLRLGGLPVTRAADTSRPLPLSVCNVSRA
jgi:hypothetical protein